jgi:hypothetical protein
MVNNDLATELAAMQDIATALEQLDPATRTRVLHWIQERFQTDAAIAEAAAPVTPPTTVELRVVPSSAKATDEGLAIGALADFFEARGPKVQTESKEPGAQSVTGMLHEFVAEFQDLAREWNADSGATELEPHNAPRLSVAS